MITFNNNLHYIWEKNFDPEYSPFHILQKKLLKKSLFFINRNIPLFKIFNKKQSKKEVHFEHQFFFLFAHNKFTTIQHKYFIEKFFLKFFSEKNFFTPLNKEYSIYAYTLLTAIKINSELLFYETFNKVKNDEQFLSFFLYVFCKEQFLQKLSFDNGLFFIFLNGFKESTLDYCKSEIFRYFNDELLIDFDKLFLRENIKNNLSNF